MKISACPSKIGFDASTYVTPATAAKFYEAGYRFVFRYLNRTKAFRETPDNTWPISLSTQELHELTDRGFAVGLVQFAGQCRDGAAKGESMVHNAQGIGVPVGAHLFCDAEGWPDVSWAHVQSYLAAWQTQVRAAGYRAGLYVGPGVQWGDLYSLPGYDCYWRAASYTPPVHHRGYAITQGMQCGVFGQTIDQDICAYDHKRGRPCMVVK